MLHRRVSLLFLAVCAVPAHAGGFELSNVIEKFGGQFSEAGVWVQTVFVFLGFCLVGWGIFMLSRNSSTGTGGRSGGGDPSYTGFIPIVFGALCLILVAVIEMVLQSSFGASTNTLDKIGL
jgi:uncharacterized membrane protein